MLSEKMRFLIAPLAALLLLFGAACDGGEPTEADPVDSPLLEDPADEGDLPLDNGEEETPST